MGDDTRIEWTDATWNPVRGCSRVSEGCRNCYAERVAARFSKPGMPYHGFAKVVAPRDSLDRVGGRRNGWTGKVALVPEKLDQPLRWTEPRRIFVNSMSDLFHEALSNEEIAAVFGVMAAAPRHTFQTLTKRHQRMRRWFEWAGGGRGHRHRLNEAVRGNVPEAGSSAVFPTRKHGMVEDPGWPLPNVWLGVSVDDRKHGLPRIDELRETPAAIRFLSIEPLLEDLGAIDLAGIDWVIVGGESGPGARPCDVEWIRSIVRQCREAGVACFVKQLGAYPVREHPTHPGDPNYNQNFPLGLRDRKGGDPAEWPEDVRVREFPEVRRG